MIVLVCGGRDFADRTLMHETLWSARPIDVLIHGGAAGADSLAGEWARDHGIPEVIVPAQWAYYGKRAGVLRNQWMLQLRPELVVAFHGGKGTANMVALAEKEGVDVYHVNG